MFLQYFNSKIRTSLEGENLRNANEIRIRLNKNIYINYSDSENEIAYKPNQFEIDEIFSKMCQYSPYAYIEDIKRGFITIENGCRVGICGRVVDDYNIKNISSLNIRIAKEIQGCSKIIADKISGNILIASAPACGKTTILRDLIRCYSNSGKNIGVADERGEISGINFDLGKRTDVMLNCSKTEGMEMILRSMAPDIIAVDELGGEDDIKSAFNIVHCGVNLIATIHAKTVDEVKYRLGELYNEFDYMVFLCGIGKVSKIYNRERIIWQ